MKNSKKGFTLVELLVVIAILAILATVAVVGYTSFTDKAHQSNDRSLVAQLNTAITRVDGKYETFHEVAEVLAENGFDVAKIKATSEDHEILWNMETQKFFYSADEALDGANIWIVADEVSEKYSTYYIGENNAVLNATLGFDAGVATGLTVNYANATAQTVVLRTNGGALKIEAANDTVNHYGSVNEVNVVAIASESYHEFGKATFIKLQAGRVEVEASAEIGGIHTTSDVARVTNESGAALPTVTKESEVTEEEARNAAVNVVPPMGVARIGLNGYETLQAAIDATASGDVIVLISDVTLAKSAYLAADDNLTLDLNGKTIDSLGEDAIDNDGTLTIIGSGTINSGLYDVIWNKGTLTIDGDCTLHAESIVNGAKSIINNRGSLTINSGIFEKIGHPANATIDNYGENVSLAIYGGTFTGCTLVNITASQFDAVIQGGTFISDANISDQGKQYMISVNPVENCSLAIEGGTFMATGETGKNTYEFNPSAYVNEETHVVTLVDGVYTVTAK